VSEALGFSEAAADWIRRNRSGLPEDLDPVSHLFVSYLSTSYEVVAGSMVRGCAGCWGCVFWDGNKHPRPRNPDRKAKSVARELKVLALRRMSEELDLPLVDRDFAKPLAAPAVALYAYVVELDRRSRLASQGEAVLALWREIAWTPAGKPKPKFRLRVPEILKARPPGARLISSSGPAAFRTGGR
jgi:hypothetical protein